METGPVRPAGHSRAAARPGQGHLGILGHTGADARVAQVEIPANDTRPLHSHPEALWHVLRDHRRADGPADRSASRPCTSGPWQAQLLQGRHGARLPQSERADGALD